MNQIVEPDHQASAAHIREMLAKYEEVELLIKMANTNMAQIVERIWPLHKVMIYAPFYAKALMNQAILMALSLNLKGWRNNDRTLIRNQKNSR